MPSSSFTRERYLAQVKRWGFDWTDWLEGGDTVASASWTSSSDLTLTLPTTTTLVTSVKVSGGSGSSGWIACTMTTAGGSVEKRVLNFSYLG